MTLLDTLLWYGDNILYYAGEMLPCMLLELAVFCVLLSPRHRRLAARGLVSSPWREGGLLLFVMFCAGLAALTVFPAGFWNLAHWQSALRGETPLFPPVDWAIQRQTLQLIPFQEIWRAFRGPWVMFLMLANIGIFFPVGFFPALLWRGWRWWKALLAGLLISCGIEFIQFFIGRSTDIDDVILNTAGALLGFGLYALFRALFPRAAARFHCQDKGV